MIERASRCHPSGLRFHDGHLYQYLDAGSSSVTPRISRMAASGGNEDVPLSILDVEQLTLEVELALAWLVISSCALSEPDLAQRVPEVAQHLHTTRHREH